LLPLFGNQSHFSDIKKLSLWGDLKLAVSVGILLEYEEVITRISGPD